MPYKTILGIIYEPISNIEDNKWNVRNQKYGYGRVSSKSQPIESQKKEFKNKGIPEKNIRI